VTLEETIEALTRWAAIEDDAFVTIGGWVASIDDPAAKVVLAQQAPHHGWHATLWQERLPVVHTMQGPVVPAGAAGLTGSTLDQRLDAVFRRFLPEALEGYRAALAAASSLSDGPVIRALELVIADEERDLAAGLRLLGERS
jgi:hypothetical protein